MKLRLDLLFKNKKKKANEKKLMVLLTIFFVFFLIGLFFAMPIFAYQFYYYNKIYPGIYIDGIEIGSLTPLEAMDKLNMFVDNLKLRGLNFKYKNNNLKVETTTLSPADPDLAYQILIFEKSKMVDQAFWYGRQNNFLVNLNKQLKALLYRQEIPLIYTLHDEYLKEILQNKFEIFENPAKNAEIVFVNETEFKIEPEKRGFIIDYEQAINDLKNNLNFLSLQTINLKTKPSLPSVTKREAEANKLLIKDILKQEKIILKYKDDNWEIERDEFKNWLAFKKANKQILLTFKPQLLKKKLKELAQEINLPAQDARFTFEDGKVTEFKPHKFGLKLDIESNFSKINDQFFARKNNEIDLIVKESEPQVKTGEVNGFGITEIIGVGESDFAGSRINRIRNITNAANHLHGMLIEPGEGFSLAERIGPVNASTGYYPEYVIKGDRTIPEYGGGLCQIATTTFRAALYSGLPIIERKPHSYIVSYYKPIGMDAAIYSPHPDVRFINDTGNYILIQTEIEDTKLTFTFWGKSDGRQVEITEPEVYNWRGPGAPRMIENSDLEPGKKKLMEHARSGADAHFYRYITRPGQEKEKEIWRSHYVAWSAIYEVGPEEASEGEEGGTEKPPENNEQPESSEE